MQKHVRHLMLDPNLVPSDKQDLISRIASSAGTLDMPCYLVGGFVRDLLLHKPVNDYDIVVEGDAIGLGRKLVGEYGGRLTSHGKFRTAIWVTNDNVSIDLITARSESYIRSGALPTINPSSILDDLRRRDFAINAMAVRLDGGHFGEVLDILSGLADLENGLIRVIHPRSFLDDPTRIFRAVRYEQRYGFTIEPGTLQLINNDSLEILSTLSGERLRHEFDLIFLEDNPGAYLIRLLDLGVLSAINSELPGIEHGYVLPSNLKADSDVGVEPDRILLGWASWLKALPRDSILSLSQRLDFSSLLRELLLSVSKLNSELSVLSGSKPSVWTALLDDLPPISIYIIWMASHESALREYLVNWRHVKPRITGDDLKLIGIPPGPAYKKILFRLRAAWLDGEIDDEQQETVLLKSLIASLPAP